MSEWSAEREALARIEDQLTRLIDVTVGLATGKSTSPKPARRPVTAVQLVRREVRVERHLQLVARVLPTAAAPEPAHERPAP